MGFKANAQLAPVQWIFIEKKTWKNRRKENEQKLSGGEEEK